MWDKLVDMARAAIVIIKSRGQDKYLVTSFERQYRDDSIACSARYEHDYNPIYCDKSLNDDAEFMIIPWNPMPRHYHCKDMDFRNNVYELDHDALYSGQDYQCCNADGM